MANYDSILKEKKIYEDLTLNKKHKSFPWFKMDVFGIIIVLIVSYVVYFVKILTPESIFLTDLNRLVGSYQKLFEPLKIIDLDNNYNFAGVISLDDISYNYVLVRNDNNIKLDLLLDDNTLSYYNMANYGYIKLASFKEEYIKLPNADYFSMLHNFKKYISNNLPTNKFIKKFYLSGTIPIVESNLVLNNEDIKLALGLDNLENSYEMLFTFKNNAITNEIISLKIVINNLTTSERKVFSYEEGIINYKDDLHNMKFLLEEMGEDFTLKIYDNDIIYSVLTGTSQGSGYQYMYQIIDKIYNITIEVDQEGVNYVYTLASKIEKDGHIVNEKMVITRQSLEDIILENTELANSFNYELLNDQEKELYNNSLEQVIGRLRQFVDKYKDGIYQVDNNNSNS